MIAEYIKVVPDTVEAILAAYEAGMISNETMKQKLAEHVQYIVA